MTPDEFREALKRTRRERSSRAVTGAQLVLIDGLTDSEAATRVGCTRQAIGCARRRIIAAAKLCPTCGRAFEK